MDLHLSILLKVKSLRIEQEKEILHLKEVKVFRLWGKEEVSHQSFSRLEIDCGAICEHFLSDQEASNQKIAGEKYESQ